MRLPHVEALMARDDIRILRTERGAREWVAALHQKRAGRPLILLACEGETLGEALSGLDELARERLRRGPRPGG